MNKMTTVMLLTVTIKCVKTRYHRHCCNIIAIITTIIIITAIIITIIAHVITEN